MKKKKTWDILILLLDLEFIEAAALKSYKFAQRLSKSCFKSNWGWIGQS